MLSLNQSVQFSSHIRQCEISVTLMYFSSNQMLLSLKFPPMVSPAVFPEPPGSPATKDSLVAQDTKATEVHTHSYKQTSS